MPSNWLIDSDNGENAYKLALRQTPELSPTVSKLTGLFSPESGSIKMSLNGMQTNLENGSNNLTGQPAIENVDLDTYRRLRYQYSTIYSNVVNNSTTTTDKNQDTSSEEDSRVNNLGEKLREVLKPVSSFLGSTTGNITGVLQSPLGSELSLPKTIQAMMNELNPSVSAKYETCYKKCCADKLGEYPGSLLGSVQQILRTSKTGEPTPINFVLDMYHGSMDALKSIKELSESISTILETFFNNILRNALPDVGRLLDSVTSFSNQLNGLSQVFSGIQQINTLTDQLQTYTSQIDNFVQNPFEAVSSYMPSQSLGGFSFQNPEQFFKKFIPPDIQNGLDKIQDIAGGSFSGKMGFGLEKALKGIRGSAISSIVDGYATQFSMLSPLFTGAPPGAIAESHDNIAGVLQAPGGPEYNIDKTTGQVIRVKKPEPLYTPKY
jgi:hypothetical protein